jgi:hypothetical protein
MVALLPSVEAAAKAVRPSLLFKGRRSFGFDGLVLVLQQQQHSIVVDSSDSSNNNNSNSNYEEDNLFILCYFIFKCDVSIII